MPQKKVRVSRCKCAYPCGCWRAPAPFPSDLIEVPNSKRFGTIPEGEFTLDSEAVPNDPFQWPLTEDGAAPDLADNPCYEWREILSRLYAEGYRFVRFAPYLIEAPTAEVARGKRKPLPKVDLGFLEEFKFVGSSGNYEWKQVCIMTGLHLAVKIAEGKTTLAEALRGDRKTSVKVECVSNEISHLAICANDAFDDGVAREVAERKAWALATLPRLLGTKGTGRAEAKILRLASRFQEEDLQLRIREGMARLSKKKKIITDDLRDLLNDVVFFDTSGLSNLEEARWRVRQLDYVLTAIGH